ncbi:hypothetical protein EDC39_10312 [Geothermobacter ehrlichii]|uniref:Uncharacterized protein n=1 Tax=Geothermobacter ehrlichii TaxID=213224 RepID=A0A5D3WL49_9BACT|nr:hypothetical protein EDC39_10312 [Geothermobacter ehrlichii]
MANDHNRLGRHFHDPICRGPKEKMFNFSVTMFAQHDERDFFLFGFFHNFLIGSSKKNCNFKIVKIFCIIINELIHCRCRISLNLLLQMIKRYMGHIKTSQINRL